MTRRSLEAIYRAVTQEELKEKGYDSLIDIVRDECTTEQGPGAGFYDGLNATNSLNIGLNDRGREIFRESALSAISRLYPDIQKDSES